MGGGGRSSVCISSCPVRTRMTATTLTDYNNRAESFGFGWAISRAKLAAPHATPRHAPPPHLSPWESIMGEEILSLPLDVSHSRTVSIRTRLAELN